eukprot:TRINITY_DN9127_c0_g1_i1.p2 TRINITY_DN9127_c0_g1~~TRINITY_DN9127_c0_g1_i1.p2  ORF type:complete len:159 (+),score=34.22 TRINITY_DN9127_c0_g1_i1:1353-1829(+)
MQQGLPDGRGFRRVEANVPDRRSQAAAGFLKALGELGTIRFVELVDAIEQAGKQGCRQDGDAFLGDDAAGQDGEIGAIGGEQGTVRRLVLAGDDEQGRVDFVGSDGDGEVVHVVVAAGDDALGPLDAGLKQRFSLGPVTDDVPCTCLLYTSPSPRDQA